MNKEKNKIKKEYIILIIIVIAIIMVDQIIKIYVSNTNEITIIKGVLNLKVEQNENLDNADTSNSGTMYVIANLIIIAIMIKFITGQNNYIDKKFKILLSFILAGAISNSIDRIFRGYVIEYVDFSQIINIPVFNIADMFVIIGWVGFAATFASFTVKELRENKINKEVKHEIEKEKISKKKKDKK